MKFLRLTPPSECLEVLGTRDMTKQRSLALGCFPTKERIDRLDLVYCTGCRHSARIPANAGYAFSCHPLSDSASTDFTVRKVGHARVNPLSIQPDADLRSGSPASGASSSSLLFTRLTLPEVPRQGLAARTRSQGHTRDLSAWPGFEPAAGAP